MFVDPRIKALTEAKYTQFRSWFDQRLDDAIAAAEKTEEAKGTRIPLNVFDI